MQNLIESINELSALLPDDVDMIEHNPDEGQSFFCCGELTNLNVGHVNHSDGCWFVKLRNALADVSS